MGGDDSQPIVLRVLVSSRELGRGRGMCLRLKKECSRTSSGIDLALGRVGCVRNPYVRSERA